MLKITTENMIYSNISPIYAKKSLKMHKSVQNMTWQTIQMCVKCTSYSKHCSKSYVNENSQPIRK